MWLYEEFVESCLPFESSLTHEPWHACSAALVLCRSRHEQFDCSFLCSHATPVDTQLRKAVQLRSTCSIPHIFSSPSPPPDLNSPLIFILFHLHPFLLFNLLSLSLITPLTYNTPPTTHKEEPIHQGRRSLHTARRPQNETHLIMLLPQLRPRTRCPSQRPR
jgi:hypothetical protein